jgi:hypothetical protein
VSVPNSQSSIYRACLYLHTSFGNLSFSILSRWFPIQPIHYLANSYLISSPLLWSNLVHPLTLLKNSISANQARLLKWQFFWLLLGRWDVSGTNLGRDNDYHSRGHWRLFSVPPSKYWIVL